MRTHNSNSLSMSDARNETVSSILRREGVLVASRSVDVSKGTPHSSQRRYAIPHQIALMESMRLRVEDLTHPLIVSVDTDELVGLARDPDNFDWPHVCEVLFLLITVDFAL